MYINGDVDKVTSAAHIGHRISLADNTSIIQAAQTQFWKSVNLLWLI